MRIWRFPRKNPVTKLHERVGMMHWTPQPKRKAQDAIFRFQFFFSPKCNPGVSCFLEDAQSDPRMAHRERERERGGKSNARLSTSPRETPATRLRGAAEYPNISPICFSPSLFKCSFSSSPWLGLKYSMTLSLITSACRGNFVRQNRNALFWRECDPRARPKKKKKKKKKKKGCSVS